MTGVGRVRVGAAAVSGALALALLSGCTSAPTSSGSSSAPSTRSTARSTVTITPSAQSSPTATITRTVQTTVFDSTVTRTTLVTTTFAPPPATKEPAAVTGDCPLISVDQVSDINGQRPGPTQLIATKPYPVCDFYRSDGGWMARVRVVVAATPEAAAAAVDQHVPVAGSSPASQPPGWSGGALVTPGGITGNPDVQSIYAVAKGKIAIIAESNQAQTVKGRQMVIDVVATLTL